VKLIKPGMDSKQVIARFEAERQALAMMDHPNIARVLDAGTISGIRSQGSGVSRQGAGEGLLTPDSCLLTPESGQPYFVMELVKGVPITRYCDEHRLTPTQRLELCVPICEAVQHAHQKGVIHRDLKPSNVMIAQYDGKPVPKVIDFGVAKATGPKLTDKTLFTEFGVVVGTLEYMSPEQAELNQLDIDTRSDIYSLGVLLYELLTGTTPLEREHVKEAGLLEALRIIREDETQRPSDRLSTTKDLPTIAASRGLEPRKLSGLVRGELDWIVMKALEKDRNRRYESANALARDVQRYLAGEPVLAVPPSTSYRLRKFARKHRAALTTATAIVLLLVAGVAVSSWLAVQAIQAKAKTQKQLEQLKKGNAIITSIFAELDMRKVKAGTDPLEAVLARRLVKAADELEGEAVGDPLVVAELQARLGRSLYGLGHSREAIPLFARAVEARKAGLGADHPDTLASMHDLAVGYLAAGKGDLAVPLLEQTLKIRKVKFGADHPDTLSSMLNLAGAYQEVGKLDLAMPLFEETLRLRKAKLGADHRDTLTSMAALGEGYRTVGKLDLAVPLLEETLRLRKARLGADHYETLASMNGLVTGYLSAGKLDLAVRLSEETLKLRKDKLGLDHPHTLGSMANLASAYKVAGKLDLALPLFEETLKLRKAKLGAGHPDTLSSMGKLAEGYRAAGKLDLALPLFQETLKLMKAQRGVDHPDTLTCMNNLAVSYLARGKLDLAVALLEETVKIRKVKLGADHPDTLSSMHNLATGYRSTGKRDLALPLLEEILRIRKVKLGADHRHTLATMGTLGLFYKEAGKLDLALPLLEETVKVMKARLGVDYPDTLICMNNLALAYLAKGKLDLALPLLEETLKLSSGKLGAGHPQTLKRMNDLARIYQDVGKLGQSETWRRKWLAVVKDQSGSDSILYAGELAALGLNLLQQKKWNDAESVFRDCLAIRAKKQPDAWTTFNTQSLLGAALMGQKKYTEAEPLLIEGYAGMKQRAEKIPSPTKMHLAEAGQRLIALYEATGNKDAAAKWRKQLERKK
jgi:serine/threonine protein kinase/tetratricopeptide (TPR) repeat protein